MKREELREKLREITTSKRVGFLYAVGNDDLLIDELENFIEQELSKAREEGRKEVLKEVEYALAKDLRYELRFTEIQEVLSKLKDNK